MTDNGLAALAEALHHYRGTCELWTISEAACPIDHRVDAGAILGEHGVFLPDGLGPVMVGMAKEIAALRAALDVHHAFLLNGVQECGLCKRAALAAAKETP